MNKETNVSLLVRSLVGTLRGDLRPFTYSVELVEKLLYQDGYSVDEILITKDVYPKVARQLGRREDAVSRSALRTAHTVWERGGRKVWGEIVGRDLIEEPTPSDIIFFLAIYLHTGKPVFSSTPVPLLSL